MHTFNGADLPYNKMDLNESIEVIKETTVVIYNTDVDKPVLEDNRNSANYDQLDENGPLQTFIDDFKQKYNILDEPHEIAIFVWNSLFINLNFCNCIVSKKMFNFPYLKTLIKIISIMYNILFSFCAVLKVLQTLT